MRSGKQEVKLQEEIEILTRFREIRDTSAAAAATQTLKAHEGGALSKNADKTSAPCRAIQFAID